MLIGGAVFGGRRARNFSFFLILESNERGFVGKGCGKYSKSSESKTAAESAKTDFRICGIMRAA